MQTAGVIGVGVLSAVLMGYAQRQQQKSQNEWIDLHAKNNTSRDHQFYLAAHAYFPISTSSATWNKLIYGQWRINTSQKVP